MALYKDLVGLDQYDILLRQIIVSIAIEAKLITDAIGTGSPPTANQIAWAKNALNNPQTEQARVFWYVIAANNTATIAQIQTATDSAVQTNVHAAVALFSA